MAEPFLDTNILIRHLTQDHPTHSPRSTAFLQRIQSGELKVTTSVLVVFETVYILQRIYRISRADIAAAILPLLDLPGIHLPEKPLISPTFDIFVNKNLSFADSFHAVLVRLLGLNEIVSFDEGFDRISWLTRVEP